MVNVDQRVLQLLLVVQCGNGGEVEGVWVFRDLLGKIALGKRKRSLEVGDGLALRLVKIQVDGIEERTPRPVVGQRKLRIIERPLGIVHKLVNEIVMMPPRHIEDNLLLLLVFTVTHKVWAILIQLGIKQIESFYAAKIGSREAACPGKPFTQVLAHHGNHPVAQRCLRILLYDVLAHAPIETQQLVILFDGSPYTRLVKAFAQTLNPILVVAIIRYQLAHIQSVLNRQQPVGSYKFTHFPRHITKESHHP